MTEHFELVDGRSVPVITHWHRRDYSAHVLRVDEGDPDDVAGSWALTWTDGINDWYEEYELPWNALARLAALVAAIEQSVFLVHDPRNPSGALDFVEESERFVARTVHASSCEPGCDGTDPANHGL